VAKLYKEPPKVQKSNELLSKPSVYHSHDSTELEKTESRKEIKLYTSKTHAKPKKSTGTKNPHPSAATVRFIFNHYW